MAEKITITSLGQMTRPQLEAIIAKAEIHAEGVFKPPPLDLVAIRERADELDPKSQLKADIYMLLIEVEKLRAEENLHHQS
jgi:hypothetical protein